MTEISSGRWRGASKLQSIIHVVADEGRSSISIQIGHGDYPPEQFAAEPGYRIAECAIEPVSANHANTSCKISDDGNTAAFNLSLTSGPLYDQWRSWWDGTVILKQTARP